MPSTTPDMLDDETRPDATPRPRPPARRIIIWAAVGVTTVWTVLLIGGVLDNSRGDGIWLHVALITWAVAAILAGDDWISRANTVAAIRIVRADLDAHHQQATVMAADTAAIGEKLDTLADQVAALAAVVGEYGDARFLSGSQAALDAITHPSLGADVLPIGGRIPAPRTAFATPTDPRCTSGAPTAGNRLL